ncbi:tctex1 domain-containing protein 2-like [Belonocnema kinseyi]|uniref:tctex1 domain-containing protein 2-like n=1 Tax=Belonocnema kinseyi TaxID=2817044 RepID=UPI00143DDCF1|nr:tctex1 domain-containing protein 2-like [Belonocnema kinseyi]
MSDTKGRSSKEDVPRKLRVSLGLERSAAASFQGSVSNRKSLSIANIASAALFLKRADGSWVPRYQNSYRLEPYNRYNPEVVDKIVKTAMENRLSTVTSYDPSEATKLSKDVTGDVLKALIKKDYDRCKHVVQVSVIQNAFQSVNVSLGCLWDIERDNYSYYVFQNNHIHAWCAVFGLYYE